MRGQKLCKSCGSANGPRSFLCRSCNAPFTFKDGGVENKIGSDLSEPTLLKTVDWKALKRGDRIRVISGSGPYWPPKEEGGDKVSMGYYGKFTVINIDAYGIHARGNKKEGESARCYIWMSENNDDKPNSYGLIKRPHKIVKLKSRKEKV